MALVFAINLLPAFGPPTGAVLVVLRLDSDIPAVPLVVGGALAAGSGRLLLALAARRLRGRLSPERREHIAAAQSALTDHRAKSLAGLGLFALSPIPSAQLFIAAGVMTVPLLPLTAAFFAGRLVSYSLYVGAAGAAKENVGDVVVDSLTSPLGIALQLLMLGLLGLLLKVDWAARLGADR